MTNSDGQAPLKSKSCLTRFSLVTYNISLCFVIQLIGENKKQMQTHKEMYLLYHKQLFFLVANIDTLIDQMGEMESLNGSTEEGVVWLRGLKYYSCFKTMGLHVRKTQVESSCCTHSCVTLGKLLNHSESQLPTL